MERASRNGENQSDHNSSSSNHTQCIQDSDDYCSETKEEAKQISINGETIQKLNYLNNIKEESKLCPFQNPNASNLEGDDGQPKNNIAITESFTEEKMKRQTKDRKTFSNCAEICDKEQFEGDSDKKELYIENLLIGVYNELK